MKANKAGQIAENLLAGVLQGCHLEFSRQVELGRNIYGGRLKVDFVVRNLEQFPSGLAVESKWQSGDGSIDEKFPYIWENIREQCYAIPVVVVIAGGGCRPGAMEWLAAKADGVRLVAVWSFRSVHRLGNAARGTVTRAALVQSTFDFAMREINALETRIVKAEDDTDAMLWEQARQVDEQLKAGRSRRQLAAQWINARTGEPYSAMHVHRTAKVFNCNFKVTPRPRFREAYNAVTNAPSPREHRDDLDTVDSDDEYDDTDDTDEASVHFASETAEHYTPSKIIEAVVACLGAIDLDPCSNTGEPNVPAARHFTIADDGLKQPWTGRVYMNPPYGRDIEAWVTKLCTEHERKDGGVTEAIALVPARTDTQWFCRLRDYICCFVEGRLTFIGNDDPAPFPSAVFYFGEDIGKFYHHFQRIGDIWQRIEPGMFGA